MRITGIDLKPLALELRQPYHWRLGAQLGANVVLCTLHTDEGTTGIGECICEHPGAVESYGGLISQFFVGRSPGDVEKILLDVWAKGRWRLFPRFSHQILGGLEAACWDAWGKAVGQPASAFLGGRVREEVDFFGFIQGHAPESLAEHARQLAAEGFRILYMKIGHEDLQRDVDSVAAVRKAAGSLVKLRVDANEAWDVPTAIDQIRRLEPFDIDWVEQPVSAGDVLGLARVRAAVQVKIAADQAVYTVDELLAVLRADAADVVVLGHHESGGLWRMRQMAGIAEAFGVPLNRHSCMETSVSTFAALQVMGAIPNLTLGNQFQHHLFTDSITQSPAFELTNGRAFLPKGPGLGFELDEAAVERCHERYVRQGPFVPY